MRRSSATLRSPSRKTLAVLAAAGIPVVADPALAMQTEADPQELHDKRTDAIKREERMDRKAKILESRMSQSPGSSGRRAQLPGRNATAPGPVGRQGLGRHPGL